MEQRSGGAAGQRASGGAEGQWWKRSPAGQGSSGGAAGQRGSGAAEQRGSGAAANDGTGSRGWKVEESIGTDDVPVYLKDFENDHATLVC